MLILSRKLNEIIVIAGSIRVSVVDIKGDQVKLGIDAPADVKIHRLEVFEAIQTENRKAAESSAMPGRALPNLPGLPSAPAGNPWD